MRIPAVAIFTLAALTSCSFASTALAKPPSGNYVVPTQTTTVTNSGAQKPSTYVVPAQTITTPNANPVIVQPGTQTKPLFTQPPLAPKTDTTKDLVVTATDVQVLGANQELQQIVLNTIATHPAGATSNSQVQKDVAAILGTGLFANASANTQSTPGGLKVVYQVQPVIVRSLQLSGAQVLTPAVANDLFKSQLNNQVSPTLIHQNIQKLNQWYANNGYVLAQVASVVPSRSGVLTIDVGEGVVGSVNLSFLDTNGKPTTGRTKQDYLMRQLKVKPGQVFQVDVARGDLKQLYSLGLFDKADISLNGDAKKVAVNYALTEHTARSVNVGGGYSADSGLVGTVTYANQNIGGINQKLNLNVQAGTRDLQFDTNFSNPYNPTDPKQLGYTINAFRRRGFNQTFDELKLANGDEPRVGQFGGGITFTQPVSDWQASVGLNYTRSSARDSNGNVAPVDDKNNQLTFSNTGIDDLVTVSAGFSKDQRNNPVNPTQGSVLSISSEQSVPVGNGNILMNRIQGNYSQYVPTAILNKSNPDVLAFNVQAGTTIGDLAPYNAFTIGGINSVRGYQNGQLASGRSFVLASAEYRFPILSLVGGVLFADYGSDLGTASSVPGQPGIEQSKPGSGLGYGAGLRLNSPLGIIRADFGLNNQGQGRLEFGIGQRF